jgi:hypothetical protein
MAASLLLLNWKLKGQLESSDFLAPIGVAVGPLIVRSSFLKAPQVLTRRQKLRNDFLFFLGFVIAEVFAILPYFYFDLSTQDLKQLWHKFVLFMFAFCIPFQIYSLVQIIRTLRSKTDNKQGTGNM